MPSTILRARLPWRRHNGAQRGRSIPVARAASSNRWRSTTSGSPYQRRAAAMGRRPHWRADSITSLPTFRQSESLPPKTDITFRCRLTSTACRRESSVHSRPSEVPPGGTTSDRTPQRSEMTSSAVMDRPNSSRVLAWSRRKERSSSVTSTSGSITRVSVVPITDRWAIGST